jgi:hypothetical protein
MGAADSRSCSNFSFVDRDWIRVVSNNEYPERLGFALGFVGPEPKKQVPTRVGTMKLRYALVPVPYVLRGIARSEAMHSSILGGTETIFCK